MTEYIFAHYRVTWKTEEGNNKAEFWLPNKNEDVDHEKLVKSHMWDLLNLAEMNASETGYKYNLSVLDIRTYRMVG